MGVGTPLRVILAQKHHFGARITLKGVLKGESGPKMTKKGQNHPKGGSRTGSGGPEPLGIRPHPERSDPIPRDPTPSGWGSGPQNHRKWVIFGTPFGGVWIGTVIFKRGFDPFLGWDRKRGPKRGPKMCPKRGQNHDFWGIYLIN